MRVSWDMFQLSSMDFAICINCSMHIWFLSSKCHRDHAIGVASWEMLSDLAFVFLRTSAVLDNDCVVGSKSWVWDSAESSVMMNILVFVWCCYCLDAALLFWDDPCSVLQGLVHFTLYFECLNISVPLPGIVQVVICCCLMCGIVLWLVGVYQKHLVNW